MDRRSFISSSVAESALSPLGEIGVESSVAYLTKVVNHETLDLLDNAPKHGAHGAAHAAGGDHGAAGEHNKGEGAKAPEAKH